MEDGYPQVILSLSTGIFGAFLGAFFRNFQLSRRCTKLEWRILDIEGRLGANQARKAALARWAPRDELAADLARVQAGKSVSAQRYDNDPMEVPAGETRWGSDRSSIT